MNQIEKRKNIAIIGAGISGISAAMELIDKDVAIDIFEAKKTIGGRVACFEDNLTGDKIDNGKHLMVGAYSNFFDLLSKLNSFKDLYFQKYFNVNFISKTGSFKFSNGKFGKLSQLISFIKLPEISLKEKENNIKFLSQIQKNDINTFGKSALQVLQDFNIGNEMINKFWSPLITATMNTIPKYAAGEIFLNILKYAFFYDNNSARLVFSNQPLQELLLPFNRIFPNYNRKIHLQTPIVSINRLNDKIIIKSKDGEEFRFDAIILAITPYALRKIEMNFSILYLENFVQSPIISLYLWSEEDFMAEDFYSLIGTNFQWIFRESTQSLRYTLTMSAAEEIVNSSKNEIFEMAYQNLETVFPKFNRNLIYNTKLIKERNATIKLTPQIERIRPRQKLYNGIYLAGDWTNTNLPSTMESAALSGRLASNHLITDLVV
ncbi:MAG: FAD-dependent oxidoreductase [Candidatus Kapabacteria bacterium]|nr:FAD-dependent oxidoreductase [Candidatus Kapabacteria bacterium]